MPTSLPEQVSKLFNRTTVKLHIKDCYTLFSSTITFFLSLGIEHLCSGTCKAVNFIGQGLCSVLDVAVGALKAAEAVVGWVNAAIQFVLQMFLIHG